MEQDQMFSQMHQAALTRLADRDPKEIARKSGVCYDETTQTFHFSSLGIDITVAYPSYAICPELPGWHRLVILHYLDLADGTALTGEEISFGQMASGMVRGGGIDRKCEQVIRELSDPDAAFFADICGKLGGEKIPSNGDVAYRIPFLPRFPVTLKVWLADEDFPASGRLLPDRAADHYLTIEDAVTVAELLLEKLTNK